MKTYAIAFCILKHHVKLLPLIMMLLPLQHGEEKKRKGENREAEKRKESKRKVKRKCDGIGQNGF